MRITLLLSLILLILPSHDAFSFDIAKYANGTPTPWTVGDSDDRHAIPELSTYGMSTHAKLAINHTSDCNKSLFTITAPSSTVHKLYKNMFDIFVDSIFRRDDGT